MDEKKLSDIAVYVIKLNDHTISPEEFDILNSIIASDRGAARYYNQLMVSIGTFQEKGKEIILDEIPIDDILREDFWKSLAEHEKEAPGVDISEEAPQRELIQKVVYPVRERHKLSKFNLISIITSVAAVLFIILFSRLGSNPDIPIAWLSKTIDAKWQDVSGQIEEGCDLYEGTLRLLQGSAQINLNSGAEVILEAPVEIELRDDNEIFLGYGRMVVNIRHSTKERFVVHTAVATVVDYGTEFGVLVDTNGNTETHVFEGEVDLRVGDDPVYYKNNLRLTGGRAGSVNNVGELKPIKVDQKRFVRSIGEAESRFGIPGKRIDLTDIVCGGNGFGTGDLHTGICRVHGIFVGDEEIQCVPERKGLPGYFPVKESSYIDGVFIPDGGDGPIVISSQDTVFAECPDTKGEYWSEIAGCRTNTDVIKFLSVLNGVRYGTRENPGLVFHPNVGITFDLDRMRRDMPGINIIRFIAKCGISEELPSDAANARFWVLVDGKSKGTYLCQGKGSKVHEINILLSSSDRFLTLITTEQENGNSYDWCIFGSPALLLEDAY